MMKYSKYIKHVLPVLLITTVFLIPDLAFCSVEASMKAVQTKFIGTIMPLLAVIGLVLAGFSFLMGNQNARAHLTAAIIGMVVGFGAPSIVSFIQGLVR